MSVFNVFTLTKVVKEFSKENSKPLKKEKLFGKQLIRFNRISELMFI